MEVGLGTDDLYKKEKIKREKRKASKQQLAKDSILILCEGTKTEPNYFKSIRSKYKMQNVFIEGTGCNTDTITEMAINAANDYSQIWCVFDRDSFKAFCFNRAFQMTEKYKNIHIAYSNEAFELWYMLHFHYYNTPIERDRYIEILSKLLKEKYKKNSKNIYSKIEKLENVAIKNAKKLIKSYGKYNPEKNNPSTTVYKLVEVLRTYKT